MKKGEIVAGQVVRILAGRNAGKAGRVRKINEKRGTVALEVEGRINWYAAGKLGALHG